MAESFTSERRRYNDTIEATDLACAIAARDIHTFRQTERNASVIGLYERIYSDFDLLIILTSNMKDEIKNSKITKSAKDWIAENRSVVNAPDKTVLGICNRGAEVFIEYHNLLIDQGIISLPSR